MKTILKISSYLVLIIMMLTLNNCQKDDFEIKNNVETKNELNIQYHIKKLSDYKDDIEFNKVFNKIVNPKINQEAAGLNDKTVMEEQYGFTIDSTTIKKLYLMEEDPIPC
ncbi:hypothetical protein [Bizionia sp.]|uniref:hypothetical protein n=1 Tax=Bizionia sp. TaxID=1954480 RepID=UPI003A93CF8A